MRLKVLLESLDNDRIALDCCWIASELCWIVVGLLVDCAGLPVDCAGVLADSMDIGFTKELPKISVRSFENSALINLPWIWGKYLYQTQTLLLSYVYT